MEIRANLVIAANGAMTLAGSSKALSSQTDRTRFHEIRQWADAILIGGATARIEPYARTPVPLYVWSRAPSLSGEALSGEAVKNSQATLMSGELGEVLSAIKARGIRRLLCEGGPALISALTTGNFLTGIYLTQTSHMGDGNFLDLAPIYTHFLVAAKSENSGESFSYLERNTGDT
jgi:riboflavin biosynthesis pyrimidine reductase